MNDHPIQVLLIDDSPADADFIRMTLLENNPRLEVSCADRLSTGLAALATKPPAVILLDLNLVDSHGQETFRKVLNKALGVPVIVVSGVNDEELAVQAIHQGIQDYLVKGTFDGTQLARAIRYAIERQALLLPADSVPTESLLPNGGNAPSLRSLAETERLIIIQTVNKVGALKAAQLLKIGKTTVYRKLKLYETSSKYHNSLRRHSD